MGTKCWEELLLIQMEERNDGEHIKDILKQIKTVSCPDELAGSLVGDLDN